MSTRVVKATRLHFAVEYSRVLSTRVLTAAYLCATTIRVNLLLSGANSDCHE